jgi:TPR repeat protein
MSKVSAGIISAALACAFSVTPVDAAETRRLALVVGNANYQKTDVLINAANDAQDMSAALRKLGFEVVHGADLRKLTFEQALAAFSAKVRPGEVVLLYFAGHGVMGSASSSGDEVENYLIPIDAQLRSPSEVPRQALSLAQLLEALDRAGAGPRIIVLDACRDNPFAEAWPADARPAGSGQGLLQPARTVLKDAYVAFATSPGDTAAENENGRNGLFTQELLKRIAKPGLSVNSLFEEVSAAVEQASGADQIPFFTAGGAAAASLVLSPLPPGAPPPLGAGFDPVSLDLKLQREALECGLALCLETAAAEITSPAVRADLLARARNAREASARAAAKAASAERPAPGPPLEAGAAGLGPAAARFVGENARTLEGWTRIGERFMSGSDGFPKDTVRGLRWLKSAGDAGGGAAAYAVATAYHNGLPGVPKDQRLAYLWIVKAAKAQHPAAFSLGGLYNLQGLGGRPKSEAEAAKWYRSGSGREDPTSYLRLAEFTRDGRGGLAKDPVLAQGWFLAGAEYGDPIAMFELGLIFLTSDGGSGFPQDDAEALKWFRKASEAGVAKADRYIGLLHEGGRAGVPRSQSEALRWYRSGAEKGDADALAKVAEAYERGKYGLSADQAEAERWYRRAATAGSGFAMARLAGGERRSSR